MSKLLKTAGLPLLAVAGISYFLKTKQGKKVLESSLDKVSDILNNKETYLHEASEKTQDIIHNWDKYCPIQKGVNYLTSFTSKTKCACDSCKCGNSSDLETISESDEFPVHVDDIVIDYKGN